MTACDANPGLFENGTPYEEVDEGIVDPGIALRRAREAGGFTLHDIAMKTCIAERYLVALEGSDFRVFPAAIYAVGFAKSFARHVGVSEPWIARAVRQQLAARSAAAPGGYA